MNATRKDGGVVKTLLSDETNPSAKVTIEGETYNWSGGILLISLAEAAHAADEAKKDFKGFGGGADRIPSGSIYGARAARTRRPGPKQPASGGARRTKAVSKAGANAGSKPAARQPARKPASSSSKKAAKSAKATTVKSESGKKSTKAELKHEIDELIESMPDTPKAGKKDESVFAKAIVSIEGKELSTMDTIRFFNSWVAWLTRGVLAYVKEKATLAAQNPLAGAASLTAFAVFNDKRFLICPGGCGAAFANVSSHFTHVTEPMFNTLLGPVCQIFGLGVINPFSPLLGMLAAAIAGIVAVATVIALSILVKQAAWHGTKLALKFVGKSFSTLKEKTAAWWRGEAKKEMAEDVKDIEKTVEYGKKAGLTSMLKAKTNGSDWEMLGFDPSKWHATKKLSEGYDDFSNWLTGKDTTKNLTQEEKKADEESEKNAKMVGALATSLVAGSKIHTITHGISHLVYGGGQLSKRAKQAVLRRAAEVERRGTRTKEGDLILRLAAKIDGRRRVRSPPSKPLSPRPRSRSPDRSHWASPKASYRTPRPARPVSPDFSQYHKEHSAAQNKEILMFYGLAAPLLALAIYAETRANA